MARRVGETTSALVGVEQTLQGLGKLAALLGRQPPLAAVEVLEALTVVAEALGDADGLEQHALA